MRSFIIPLFVVLAASGSAQADQSKKSSKIGTPRNECAELINECYAISGIERSNCLYSNSQLPACAKSRIGSLAFQRWGSAPDRGADIEGAPAFLGPSTKSDKECLASFDHEFSAALRNKAPNNDTLGKLQSKLNSCKSDVEIDLRS